MDAFCLIPFAVVVGAILCFCIYRVDHRRRLFEREFPPITDEEFLARCRPGTNAEIALKVRRIISRSLGVDYERIYPSSRFFDDFGAC